MRNLSLAVILIALAGCRTTPLPDGTLGGGGGGDAPDLGGAPVDGAAAASCTEPDGTVVAVGTLDVAQMLLPGRWRLCSRTSDTMGPWSVAAFAGIELANGATSDGAAGGDWWFLAEAADGSVTRAGGFDGGGTFLYNPLPGPDWEQIHLSASGQYADFTVAFTDHPRKLRIQDGAAFSAVYVPIAP